MARENRSHPPATAKPFVSHPSTDPQKAQPLWTFLVRIYWAMFGPGLLVLMLILIAMQKKAWLGGIDGAFAVVLLLIVIARWIDFLYADPTLTTGEVATVPQIRNHSLLAVVIGLASWIVATLLGIYFLG